MLFEDNLTFLILKVLVTYMGTMAMMFSTTSFKIIRKKLSATLIFIYSISIILSTYLIIVLFGWNQLLKVFIFTISFPTILLLFFISDEPFARIAFSHLSHILFSLYIAFSVTLINSALHGTELLDILLRILFYLPVVLFDFFIMRHIWLDFVRMIKKGWGILALIPCSFIFLFLTLALYPEHYTKSPTSIFMLYLLCVVIITVYISIGSYLLMQYRRQMHEYNKELLELQVENIRKENANIEALEKQTKIIRHDLRHMLSAILFLAESEEAKAILDYIENNDVLSFDIPASIHYSDNSILDATLTGYLESARNQGITVETSISIPEILPVDSLELAICFSNMLEIAIQCCKELTKQEKKLTVRSTNSPALKFEAICPIQDKIKINKRGVLTTQDSRVNNSVQSIVTFCDRNDAAYSFKAENNLLQITVSLRQSKESKE